LTALIEAILLLLVLGCPKFVSLRNQVVVQTFERAVQLVEILGDLILRNCILVWLQGTHCLHDSLYFTYLLDQVLHNFTLVSQVAELLLVHRSQRHFVILKFMLALLLQLAEVFFDLLYFVLVKISLLGWRGRGV